MINEMSYDEMLDINGGGWKAAGAALAGTIAVATSPITAVVAGPKAGVTQARYGGKVIKWACDNPDK